MPIESNIATLTSAGWDINARGAVSTLLVGDSMVDTAESFAFTTPSSISYSGTSGLLTATLSAHGLWTGVRVKFWNYNYPELRDFRVLTATRVDANTYTLPIGRLATVPDGNLPATLFAHPVIGVLNWTHWLGILQQRMGWPLDIVANLAQNGETSAGMLARLAGNLAAYTPALVVFQLLGLNDVGLSSSGNQPDYKVFANNRTIIQRILDKGAKLLLLTTTPVASGEVRGNIATMQQIANINADAIEYVKGNPNVVVVDAYSKILDPTNTTGFAVAARLRSADLIHYNYTGSALVHPDCATAVAALFPTRASTLTKSVIDCHQGNKLTISSLSRATDGATVTFTSSGAHNYRVGDTFWLMSVSAAENGVYTVKSVPTTTTFTYTKAGPAGAISAGSAVATRSRNCFNNNLFQTTTGGTVGNGVTGTAASRITCINGAGNTGTLTCVASVAAAAHGFGNEQLMTATAAAAADILRISEVGSTSFLNDLLPDREYLLEFALRLTSTSWGATPITNLIGGFSVDWSTGESYSVAVVNGYDGVEPVTIKEDQTLHVRSGRLMTVTPQPGATITGAHFFIGATIGAGGFAGQTVVLGLSRVSIRDVMA